MIGMERDARKSRKNAIKMRNGTKNATSMLYADSGRKVGHFICASGAHE